MEEQFRRWLDASPEHRIAFERCTDVWQDVAKLPRTPGLADQRGTASRPSRRRLYGALAAGAVLAGVAPLALILGRETAAYDTGVGEYRQVVLADGSRVRLNTSTRLQVSLSPRRREIALQGGEAMFEVAPDPERPFVVVAGDRQVRALGTVFTVRLLPAAAYPLSVTLIEGAVEVGSPASVQDTSPVVTLQPGQRLRQRRGSSEPQVDRPPAAVATAWTRQEVLLEDLTLAEAVLEVNRYSRRPVVLDADPALTTLRVGGLYRAGDVEGFARAVGHLHGLDVQTDPDRVLIRALPGTKAH